MTDENGTEAVNYTQELRDLEGNETECLTNNTVPALGSNVTVSDYDPAKAPDRVTCENILKHEPRNPNSYYTISVNKNFVKKQLNIKERY